MSQSEKDWLILFLERKITMKRTILKMIAVSLASVIALAGCSKDASQQETAETAYKSITTEEVS